MVSVYAFMWLFILLGVTCFNFFPLCQLLLPIISLYILEPFLLVLFIPAAINAQASARKSPHFASTGAAPGTSSRLSFSSRKSLSPYLDLQTLPAQSIVQPSLRKSLGGQASRGRTPFDALKSPGMHLARSAIRSALSNTSAGNG